MRIAFCKGDSFHARFIRFFTWSQWHHVCAIVDGAVYEAVGLGVRRVPVEHLLQRYPSTVMLDVHLPDEDKAKAFLESQLGKPYDFRAIFGFFTQRDWAEEDKWFCSELVETAIMRGGKQRFRERMNRITPQHVWMATL